MDTERISSAIKRGTNLAILRESCSCVWLSYVDPGWIAFFGEHYSCSMNIADVYRWNASLRCVVLDLWRG
jgi:hypothetical protein